MTGSFLTHQVTISFSRESLLHGAVISNSDKSSNDNKIKHINTSTTVTAAEATAIQKQ
jgi:hypothetical protein